MGTELDPSVSWGTALPPEPLAPLPYLAKGMVVQGFNPFIIDPLLSYLVFRSTIGEVVLL